MFDSVQELCRIFKNIGHHGIKLPKNVLNQVSITRQQGLKTFCRAHEKVQGVTPVRRRIDTKLGLGHMETLLLVCSQKVHIKFHIYVTKNCLFEIED